MQFGVSNGTSCVQRKMDNFVRNNKLNDTFLFMDNVTICGNTLEEHDQNLLKFRIAAKKDNLTLNEEKCVFSTEVIDLLGYRISHNSFQWIHIV